MAKKPVNWWLWTKMVVAGGIVCIGGPVFTMWVTPTDEELFKKYNPELQKRSLERRYERQKEFDDFVGKLKAYSKSDKPIWYVQKEEEERARKAELARDGAEQSRVLEMEKQLQNERHKEMRREAGLSTA